MRGGLAEDDGIAVGVFGDEGGYPASFLCGGGLGDLLLE